MRWIAVFSVIWSFPSRCQFEARLAAMPPCLIGMQDICRRASPATIGVDLLDMAVLLHNPVQRHALTVQEHGQTFPLAEVRPDNRLQALDNF
jgi:hypothetical protein